MASECEPRRSPGPRIQSVTPRCVGERKCSPLCPSRGSSGLQQARHTAEHDGPRIVLGHLQCDGARTSTGQELVGGAITVGLADLSLARADAVVLGHVHLPQRWDINGCPVIYTGSPFHKDFGESEEKSVALIELSRLDGAWCASVTQIPTPCRRMVKMEATWQDGEFVDKSPGDALSAVRNADVRFR